MATNNWCFKGVFSMGTVSGEGRSAASSRGPERGNLGEFRTEAGEGKRWKTQPGQIRLPSDQARLAKSGAIADPPLTFQAGSSSDWQRALNATRISLAKLIRQLSVLDQSRQESVIETPWRSSSLPLTSRL